MHEKVCCSCSHTAALYIPWSKIETDFVVLFKLGPINNHIYIVNVDNNIIDPLFAFKDYGGMVLIVKNTSACCQIVSGGCDM